MLSVYRNILEFFSTQNGFKRSCVLTLNKAMDQVLRYKAKLFSQSWDYCVRKKQLHLMLCRRRQLIEIQFKEVFCLRGFPEACPQPYKRLKATALAASSRF